MLEPLFDKVSGLEAFNIIKKRFQQRCFPANIAAKILKLSILKNICERLLLSDLSSRFSMSVNRTLLIYTEPSQTFKKELSLKVTDGFNG